MAETEQLNAAAYDKVIALAKRDPAFKTRLLADPHAALKDAGISVPAGVTIKVVENTDAHFYFVLSKLPGVIPDEALDKVRGERDTTSLPGTHAANSPAAVAFSSTQRTSRVATSARSSRGSGKGR